jgi:hypothetical protein
MVGFRKVNATKIWTPTVKGGNHKQIKIKMFTGHFKPLTVNSPFYKNETKLIASVIIRRAGCSILFNSKLLVYENRIFTCIYSCVEHL